MSKIPQTLDARTLARILSPIIYICESTILRNITRYPESLPPYEEIGGVGGKKIFDTQKVIDFYPPDIGTAIRRALEREWNGILEKKSTENCPPKIKSIAEELFATSLGEYDEE